jgi:septum formation protein
MTTTPPNISPLLVLASASPRRRELLHQVGVRFAVAPAEVDETALPEETADAHVRRLSLAKAKAAEQTGIGGRWFLGSDTVVVLQGEILGKPVDSGDARRMLAALAGRRHQVLTGYAIVDRETGVKVHGVVSTSVWFRPLTAAEIDRYIATGEPLDKAGAYGIQGRGGCLVQRIDGSYSNVVGLPLCEVTEALRQLGALELFADMREDEG